MSTAIGFLDVSRHYGEVKALDHVSFGVEEGEFFSMLGPSGSGKTTSLRLIAGFETTTSGRVFIDGQEAQEIPPYNRNVNTVFQDYALFPHMTILENVAYGLMVKGMPRKEYRRKAEAMLELVKLRDVGRRKPAQLSGGQRQRIALARALVNQPRVLLLDEPLGALDLKLRKQMQLELKSLQRQLGITFVYVTHDQDEALSMSDRVAVFHNGRIEQIGTPEAIYERPESPFVADFVGDANVLAPEHARDFCPDGCTCSIRPERIVFVDGALAPDAYWKAEGTVLDVNYHGANVQYAMQLANGAPVTVSVATGGVCAAPAVEPGTVREIAWLKSDMRVFGAGRGAGGGAA
ncbi:spermidine/putrescine ABC transporter ATPase subunit [Pseudodesulfovibrio mercurii]|uniref:Spermidine/putrescine ABC transporter ATPase subunit n=1 Tax=Pseudodesulfovibrio mercurii TaxID=641491 RepID=F0JFR8_9BACT|nr:ABC transporter ATP-binding protein [Pseudodesulfovibrio mercurii]EGB13746.1 spermidine/putrescine ABC transporter ATPase subunit [Pseudodesulfovibrio mercurii]